MDIDLILEPDLRPEEVRELGLLAESYGFRTLWIQNYARARDAFLTAVPLAMATRTLRVGVVVISPYEMHPLKIANSMATLAEFANGRACAVIGAGGEWNGVMAKGYGKRLTTAREALQIIIGALSSPGFSFKGEVFQARGFAMPWHKTPRPEIYCGASGEKMLAIGAEFADGIMMSDMQIPMLPNHLPHLTRAMAAQGRTPADFHVNNFIAWHVQEDEQASYRESRREMMIRGWLERPWLEPFLSPEELSIVEANKDAFLQAFRDRSGDIRDVPPDIVQTLVDELSMAGNPSAIDKHIQTLRKFAEAGFTEIGLRVHDSPEYSIKMIGEQVLPALH